MNVCRLIVAGHLQRPSALRVSLIPLDAEPLPEHVRADYRVGRDQPLTLEEARHHAPDLLSTLELDPERGPFHGDLRHAEIIVRAQSEHFRLIGHPQG